MSDLLRHYNRELIRVTCRNTVLSTTLENINELSNPFLYAGSAFGQTAAKVDVISSNTADASAGTGARKVYLIGLDSNYNLQTEEITMNGQTAVVSTKDWLRVFSAEASLCGTGLVNAGDIYVYKTGTGGTITAGVPGTLTSAWIKVLAGYGFGTSGLYTVPLGSKVRLEKLIIGARTQPGELQVYSQKLADTTDNGLHCEGMYALGNTCLEQITFPNDNSFWFDEKTDIFFRGLSSTAAGTITVDALLRSVRN